MRVRMTYEEALEGFQEAVEHQKRLHPDDELQYLVKAQVESYRRLVEAFKKHK